MTDYTDSTPYDPTVLHSVSDSAQAIRTKMYGKDTREAMAQMGEKLVAEMTDTGYNGAETRDARGSFNTLGARENSQDTQIATKSDKSYVDAMLASIAQGGPKGIFYSLSALQTAYPSGTAGTYLVFDPSSTDGAHSYIWDSKSNTWKNLGVYQAFDIEQGGVTFDSLSSILQESFIPKVEEIKITSWHKGYINYNDGQAVADDRAQYSNPISVAFGEVYCIRGTNFYDGRTVIFKNSAGIVVGCYPSASDANDVSLIFSVPINATVMIINQQYFNYLLQNTFLFKVDNFSESQKIFSNLASTLLSNKDLIFEPVDLTPKSGGYWNSQTGYFQADDKQTAYEFFSVNPFETYHLKGASYFQANLFNVYDYFGNLIFSFPNTNADTQVVDTNVTIPINGRFIGVNQIASQEKVIFEKAVAFKEPGLGFGKKWVAIGDSWTASDTLGTTISNYTDYVSNVLDIKLSNLGIGGTGYINGGSNSVQQFKNRAFPNDADVYTILGSFNDLYATGFTFGTNADTAETSLWVGVKAVLDAIWSVKSDAKIGIIAPGPWGTVNSQNEDNLQALNMSYADAGEKYIETLREIAKYYSIPFLDLYHESNLRPWNDDFINNYYHGTSSTDTTHPNTKGHKIMSSTIANFVEKLILG